MKEGSRQSSDQVTRRRVICRAVTPPLPPLPPRQDPAFTSIRRSSETHSLLGPAAWRGAGRRANTPQQAGSVGCHSPNSLGLRGICRPFSVSLSPLCDVGTFIVRTPCWGEGGALLISSVAQKAQGLANRGKLLKFLSQEKRFSLRR